MLLKKEGYPEEDSLVLCTVTNIHYHSVFAKLDLYDKTGLIHISEISPGRIRNIRDYVVEGKKIVCKVLRIDLSKGHIDLSLRRVNDNQKRKKINEIKQEQKAEKIVEQTAKLNKLKPEAFYKSITKIIFKKYPDLTTCFKETVDKPDTLEKLGIDKKHAKTMVEMIKVRFKPEELVITGTLKLSSTQPDGMEIIKKHLLEAQKVDKAVKISYLGGGAYKIEVTSLDYKEAEKILDKTLKAATAFTEKGLGTAEFARKE